MKRFLLVLLTLMCYSCIENNIPYPIVELYITDIEGEGFEVKSVNSQDRAIVLDLEERTFIESVQINAVSYSPNVDMTSSIDLSAPMNFLLPQYVTLSLYQDYLWTISAEQTIDRYFKVEGQFGEEVIDAASRRITAYVLESTDLTNVVVTDLKLGPEEITSYDVELSDLAEFSSYRVVRISYHNTVDEPWYLYVLPTDVAVSISKWDIRATTATLTVAGDTSGELGIYYRVSGSVDWAEVSGDDIELSNGQFSTKITGLIPDTDYEFMAYVADEESEVVSSRTEKMLDLPNSDFEDWSFPSMYNGTTNKSWFPFLEGESGFWGTGNQGSTTLGDSYNLTTPTEDVRTGSNGVTAVSLTTRNILKLATGSIFTGQFLKTAGTNGVIGMGRSFTSRPEGLRGWLKYDCGVVDMTGTIPPGVTIVKNETMDQGSIFVALGTWTAEEYGVSSYETVSLGTSDVPLIVDTRDSGTFFDKDGKDVVAYGELILSESVEEWTQFEIELEYRTLDVQPTHIIIVCSASRYGDYFTGSTKSAMVLDDLELVWE
ncbi:MAG: PCMD domain-containing protein [Rikenellaceae bacterium]